MIINDPNSQHCQKCHNSWREDDCFPAVFNICLRARMMIVADDCSGLSKLETTVEQPATFVLLKIIMRFL